MRGVRIAAPAVLVAMASAAPATGAAVDPRSLCLRVGDLPRGTTAGTALILSNRQAGARDGVPPPEYDRQGRLTGFSIDFFRAAINGIGYSWFVRADCRVSEYRSWVGAHWEYLRDRALVAIGAVPGTTTAGADTDTGLASFSYRYRRVAAPAVGNERTAFTADSAADEFAYTTRAYVFRRGATVAIVHVMGLQHFRPWRADRLVALVDRRVAQQ